MNILIAPDKFRGSLDAEEVCNAAEKGVLLALPGATIIKAPLADGGEGTAQILTRNTGGRFVQTIVTDPIGRRIPATYGVSGDGTTAYIEMSAASGLSLLKKEEQNPLATSTAGTGELIAHALESGVTTIVLGIGGSATNDAGTGMARALGFRFLDKNGLEIVPVGGNLGEISAIQGDNAHPKLKKSRILVACDVTNPLFGPNGAAFVYAPQKGADDAMVLHLDSGLRSLAKTASGHFGTDVSEKPGAGAAGGLGAGAIWFLGAELHEGIKIVMDQLGIPEKIRGMNLVITGEGKADAQTLSGKVVKGLAELCRESGVPLALVCGTLAITPEEAREAGITYAASVLNRPMDLDTAQSEASERITETVFYLVRLLAVQQAFKNG